MHKDRRTSREPRFRAIHRKRHKRHHFRAPRTSTQPPTIHDDDDDDATENSFKIVMLEKKRHPLRGSYVPALLLLIGSCALQSRAAAFPDWTDCPAVCRCKWTSGKKSALCPDAGLTALPATLDPDMQVLDLSGNRIPSLGSEVFKRAGLVNLQRVFVRNAAVQKIHVDAFREMGILVEIDLSDNDLRSLQPGTFRGNDRLRILILNGNPLGTIVTQQFPTLQHLRNLELQRCGLKEIQGHAFARLPGLESLKIDQNDLEFLESSVISDLKRLTTLTMDANNWNCDCRLRDFRDWIISEGLPRKLYATSQICREPGRLRDRRWETVESDEFACEPEVFVLANTLHDDTIGNLSLACLATGDPQPEVWWQFNGGHLNFTRIEQTFSESYTTNSEILNRDSFTAIVQRWNNLTIYNATEADAGEYACFAKNVASTAKDSVNIVVPRAFSAPTLSQTDDWLLWMTLAGGATAAIFASVTAIFLVICLCGNHRGNNEKREKRKFKGSSSFGDQEKKLLDLSVTTTTTTGNVSGNLNDRSSGHGSLNDTCSPGDFELNERDCYDEVINATSVTVERFRSDNNVNSCSRNVVNCQNVFPPPPPEFTTGVLPTGIFGNIFISVSVPQDGELCYPDLLDIPCHAACGNDDEKNFGNQRKSGTSMIANFATLPRRNLRSNVGDLGSPYDNMGPRITATGSSTFSLTDDLEFSGNGQNSRIIEPPIEFVSL